MTHLVPVQPAAASLCLAYLFPRNVFFLFYFPFLSWTFPLLLSCHFSPLHSENQKSIASMRVNPGLPNPSPVDILCLIISCCGDSSVQEVQLHPWLHLPVMTISNVSRNCPVSSGMQNHPWLRTTGGCPAARIWTTVGICRFGARGLRLSLCRGAGSGRSVPWRPSQAAAALLELRLSACARSAAAWSLGVRAP